MGINTGNMQTKYWSLMSSVWNSSCTSYLSSQALKPIPFSWFFFHWLLTFFFFFFLHVEIQASSEMTVSYWFFSWPTDFFSWKHLTILDNCNGFFPFHLQQSILKKPDKHRFYKRLSTGWPVHHWCPLCKSLTTENTDHSFNVTPCLREKLFR